MNKTKSLATKRAEKFESNKEWSVRDCLEEMIRLIDLGEIKPDRLIAILATERHDEGDGAEDIDTFYVNCDIRTIVAILSAGLQSHTDKYRGR